MPLESFSCGMPLRKNFVTTKKCEEAKDWCRIGKAPVLRAHKADTRSVKSHGKGDAKDEVSTTKSASTIYLGVDQ